MSASAAALRGVNLLSLTPMAMAESSQVEGRLVLHRPRPARGGWRAMWGWFTYYLSARRIRLDEFGTFAWLQFDGRCTAGEIAERMRARYGPSVEPIEQRLGAFIRLLRREGLVAYAGWDDEG